MELETYPGTDYLIRICAGECGEPIPTLADMWVDSDEDVVVCTADKLKIEQEYPFPDSHFRPATDYLPEDLKELGD